MLFTREQLEGFYYLMVGILLLVGIPLFCERFHSGGDDGGEEELWAEVGGAVTFYDDSLFLPPSNSSSSNTPISAGSGTSASGGSNVSVSNSSGIVGKGSVLGGSGVSDGLSVSGGVLGSQSGGGTGAGSSGGTAGNQSGGSAGNQGGVSGGQSGGVTGVGSSGSSQSSASSRNSTSSGSSGPGRSGGSQGRSYGQREVKVVEINRADSALLTTVRGIGPVYASKIIRYRERLGGFFDTRQLKELNLTYFDYDAISPYLRVDTTFIEKRHIEELTFKELLRHPYLEYEVVSLIFQYERENPGEPVTIEQLGEAGILRSAQIKKLSPYFY